MRYNLGDGTTVEGTPDELVEFLRKLRATPRKAGDPVVDRWSRYRPADPVAWPPNRVAGDDGHDADCPARGCVGWFSVTPCCSRATTPTPVCNDTLGALTVSLGEYDDGDDTGAITQS